MISQITVIVAPVGRSNADDAGKTAGLIKTMDSIGEFALPFLLIANIALILDTENGCRRTLLNGAAPRRRCEGFSIWCSAAIS